MRHVSATWKHVTVKCWYCHKEFQAYYTFRKYCTKKCKILYAKENGYVLRGVEKVENKAVRAKSYRKRQFENGLCKSCNKPIWKGVRCEYHYKQDQKLDRIRKAKRDYGILWDKQVELLTINDIIEELENGTKEITKGKTSTAGNLISQRT